VKRTTVAALAATAVACLALAAAATAQSQRTAAHKASLTKITFMADYPRPPWVAQIPWVVAMNKGWYKAAGLDVKYVFPSTPADPARFIGIGRADITVSYTPDLLTAASKGLKVKALASVFDRNVEGIEVWKSSGITTPKQLEGHTVAIYDFPMAKLNWQTFAAHYGIDTKKVKIVSEGNYGVPLIVANKVDGIDAAAPSELVDSEIQAKKSARFWVYLKQNGIPNFYWFIIAANSDWANKNPAAAKAFVSVTMKAVKWSFQHQKEAVNIFVQTYKKDVSPELASKAWAQIVKYDSTRFEPSKPAGWMDPGIWRSYEQFLVQKKFLTTNVNVDDVLTGNRFVGTSK
jgi:putative hydroxymethylpyrimidine transport system substrate-binding protein